MRKKPSQLIASDLREAIARGDYTAGEQLPTGNELMARYGVARQTVQNAIDQLRAAGLVAGRPGAGWFVRPNRTISSIIRTERIPGTWQYIVEKVTTRLATRNDADVGDVEPGQPLLVVHRSIRDAAGHQVHTEELVFSGEDHELVYEIPAP